jgi:hypothetical protein
LTVSLHTERQTLHNTNQLSVPPPERLSSPKFGQFPRSFHRTETSQARTLGPRGETHPPWTRARQDLCPCGTTTKTRSPWHLTLHRCHHPRMDLLPSSASSSRTDPFTSNDAHLVSAWCVSCARVLVLCHCPTAHATPSASRPTPRTRTSSACFFPLIPLLTRVLPLNRPHAPTLRASDMARAATAPLSSLKRGVERDLPLRRPRSPHKTRSL